MKKFDHEDPIVLLRYPLGIFTLNDTCELQKVFYVNYGYIYIKNVYITDGICHGNYTKLLQNAISWRTVHNNV